MIKEFDFYHGVVISRILHTSRREISIKSYSENDNASYVIDSKRGIYIKYCTKRLSPWRFSFQKKHHDEILNMKNTIGNVYLLLVCNDDGIVVLNFSEIREILDEVYKSVDWVSVARVKGKMYTVKGSDGKLRFKVGRNEFPNKIFTTEQ